MKQFVVKYLAYSKTLLKNPALYIWFLVILAGEHSPLGKVIAIFLSIAIIPLFQMWYDRLQKKFGAS